MDPIAAKEQFSLNLLNPDDRKYGVTVLYIVYKTIEQNQNITLNQLMWLLNAKYMLTAQTVTGSVASLTSETLFNCVSRWQQPGKEAIIHLKVRPVDGEFEEWLNKTLSENPELSVFKAPSFSKSKSQ